MCLVEDEIFIKHERAVPEHSSVLHAIYISFIFLVYTTFSL